MLGSLSAYIRSVGLVLIEVYALESNGYKTLLSLVEELSYGDLAILNIFLFHEA